MTIQFVSVERQDRLVADRDPLSHITYFERDDVLVACVRSVGADHVGLEHIIERPHTIIVEGSSANAVRRIDIHGADGTRTPDHAARRPGLLGCADGDCQATSGARRAQRRPQQDGQAVSAGQIAAVCPPPWQNRPDLVTQALWLLQAHSLVLVAAGPARTWKITAADG